MTALDPSFERRGTEAPLRRAVSQATVVGGGLRVEENKERRKRNTTDERAGERCAEVRSKRGSGRFRKGGGDGGLEQEAVIVDLRVAAEPHRPPRRLRVDLVAEPVAGERLRNQGPVQVAGRHPLRRRI